MAYFREKRLVFECSVPFGSTASQEILWLFFILQLIWICDLTSRVASLLCFCWPFLPSSDMEIGQTASIHAQSLIPETLLFKLKATKTDAGLFLIELSICALLRCSRIQLVQAGWALRMQKDLLEQKQHRDDL